MMQSLALALVAFGAMAAAAPVSFVSFLHFQDLIRDTPYNLRPPTLMAFINNSNEECAIKFSELKYSTAGLPNRHKLLVGRYDMQSQYSYPWFKFTDDMDMPKIFGITECPTLVMIRPEYSGRAGENDTLNHVTWDGRGNWRDWAKTTIATMREPDSDADWPLQRISNRDQVETRTHMRISKVPARLPKYTELGYKKIPMPDDLYDAMMTFFKNNEDKRSSEVWDPVSTQLNQHEAKMTMVSLDNNFTERNRIANDLVRPILADWINVKTEDLTFRSFYGIREYYRGNELRTHIDVIKTHVISAILNLNQEGMDEEWPLEVIDHNGERVKLTMNPKEMILYESATLPHGRPTPLQGYRFSNAFVHFSTRGWDFVEDTDGVPYSPSNYKGFGLKDLEDIRDPNEGIRRARFRNNADKTAKLFWQGTDGPVLQGEVPSGQEILIDTFEGHEFFWSLSPRGQKLRTHTVSKEPLYVHYDEL